MLSSHFLVDASFGRALNRILETPSANDWQVTDFRVTPRAITGGLGFYEAGNRSNNWQFQAKATNIVAGYGQHQVRYGFDYENLDFSQLIQYSGPTFTAPNGQQTATGATVDIFPDPVFGQIYHVSNASLTARAPDDAALRRALRRGRVEDRQLADDPSRPALRAGDDVGHARAGLLAQEQLGAANRRRLGSDRQRQRPRCSRTTAATTPACRAISPPARCRPTRRSPPTTSMRT